jgi:hypothetical protein
VPKVSKTGIAFGTRRILAEVISRQLMGQKAGSALLVFNGRINGCNDTV